MSAKDYLKSIENGKDNYTRAEVIVFAEKYVEYLSSKKFELWRLQQ